MKGEVTASELRKKDNNELNVRRLELKREMFLLRSKAAVSGEKLASKKVRECRKEIARILTVENERELELSLREPLL